MRGRGVIHRGESFVWAANFQSALAETGEGLRRGHLVDEMQVNVEDGRESQVVRATTCESQTFSKRVLWHRLSFEPPSTQRKPCYFHLCELRDLCG